MLEFCPICGNVLIPTSFDRAGIVIAVGMGCEDFHYSKVFGNGVLSEIVDGEWFSCSMTAPMSEKVEWQRIVNQAVFKSRQKYKAGQPKLARL